MHFEVEAQLPPGYGLIYDNEFNDNPTTILNTSGNVTQNNGTIKLNALLGNGASWYSGTKFLYGYFEARMKLPSSSTHTWSVWWLFSPSNPDGAYQEIDMSEAEFYDQHTTSASVYYNPPPPDPGKYDGMHPTPVDFPTEKYYATPAVDLSADFHVYSCLWTPSSVIIWIDGVEIPNNWGLDAQHQLKRAMNMNLTLSNNYNIQQTFEIDYLKVYQNQTMGSFYTKADPPFCPNMGSVFYHLYAPFYEQGQYNWSSSSPNLTVTPVDFVSYDMLNIPYGVYKWANMSASAPGNYVVTCLITFPSWSNPVTLTYNVQVLDPGNTNFASGGTISYTTASGQYNIKSLNTVNQIPINANPVEIKVNPPPPDGNFNWSPPISSYGSALTYSGIDRTLDVRFTNPSASGAGATFQFSANVNNNCPVKQNFTIAMQNGGFFSYKASPNPATSNITIEAVKKIISADMASQESEAEANLSFEVKLFDKNSQFIRGVKNVVGAKTVNLKVSDLPKGRYILQILHDGIIESSQVDTQ